MSRPIGVPPLVVPDAVPIGVPAALLRQLDRVVRRVVTLEPEFSDSHRHRLRGELTMFERALDDVQRELQSHALALASRLAAERTL